MKTYQEFIADIQRIQDKIADLADKRDSLNELLNQIYTQMNEIGRDISFNERAYQKLSLEIKAKEIEIKIMGISDKSKYYNKKPLLFIITQTTCSVKRAV